MKVKRLFSLPYACRRSCSFSCRLCRPTAGSDGQDRERVNRAPGRGVPEQRQSQRSAVVVRRLVASLWRGWSGTQGKSDRPPLPEPVLPRRRNSFRLRMRRLNSTTMKSLLERRRTKPVRTDTSTVIQLSNQYSEQCLWCCYYDKVIAKVHTVPLMNVESSQVVSGPESKPADEVIPSVRCYCLHLPLPFIIILSLTSNLMAVRHIGFDRK